MTHTTTNQGKRFIAELNNSVINVSEETLQKIRELIDIRGKSKEIVSFRKVKTIEQQINETEELAFQLQQSSKMLSLLVCDLSTEDPGKTLGVFELISSYIDTNLLTRCKNFLKELELVLEYEENN